MGLNSTLNAAKAVLVDNSANFTTDNVSVLDEAVFNYIQTDENAPLYCVIIDYGGFSTSSQREFNSTSPSWIIEYNYFHVIPDDGDYFQAYLNGIAFIDELIPIISANPRLGGNVAGAFVVDGNSPLVWERGNHWYVLMNVSVEAIENIS